MENDKILISIEEAAQTMSLGRSKFLKLVYSGEIQSLVIGRRRLINPLAIEAYVASLEVEQGHDTATF